MRAQQVKNTLAEMPPARPREPARPRTRTPSDPQTRLIARLLSVAESKASLVNIHTRPWASATFIGAQHHIILEIVEDVSGKAAQALSENLPEAEFAIAGHIVADAVIDSREARVQDGNLITLFHLTVLTIEDW